MMSRFGEFPERVPISIRPDDEGFTGRECPNKQCLGYFKIEFGTGLKGEGLPCHCPYCGHTAPQEQFWTKEQIEYAKSVAMREISDEFVKEFKKLDFDIPARGAFGIGFSMKVKPGRRYPIRHYREKRLETEVVCNCCTLRYAIYGVFGHCPDCGIHNSPQILEKNLDLAAKEVELAGQLESADLAEYLIADALKNVVSAFDGFGRETCRVRAEVSASPREAESVSFQNLDGARRRVQDLFAVDLADALDADEWGFACRCFQKRHLLSHKMGVMDEAYFEATGDLEAVVGRKVPVKSDEVLHVIDLIRLLGTFLVEQLPEPNPAVRARGDGDT